MGQPVVHFEITGSDPEQLRSFYRALFEWEFDTNASVEATPWSVGAVDGFHTTS
jgi:predicted enzyme related to lactoylglutathione lyase